MAEQPALGFAGLLRQLRAQARLTQEELAEAAGLSPRSVSDLERGINRTGRKDTAELLAAALAWPSRCALCSWRRPAAASRPRRCWPPCRGRLLAGGRRGRGALIWGWCHSRSGMRGFFTGATIWSPGWCSGL